MNLLKKKKSFLLDVAWSTKKLVADSVFTIIIRF